MLKQLTSDRFASIYDINTNQSTITSRVDQYTNSGWRLYDKTLECVVEGPVNYNDPSIYDTTLRYVNQKNDTLIELYKASIKK